MPTILDLHELGETNFRSIQEQALRDARRFRRASRPPTWDPTASSLTRQAWAYQQHLMDLMGEVPGMGDVAPDAKPVAQNQKLMNCGKAIATLVLVSYAAGKVGLAKLAFGIGATYLALEAFEHACAKR